MSLGMFLLLKLLGGFLHPSQSVQRDQLEKPDQPELNK